MQYREPFTSESEGCLCVAEGIVKPMKSIGVLGPAQSYRSELLEMS